MIDLILFIYFMDGIFLYFMRLFENHFTNRRCHQSCFKEFYPFSFYTLHLKKLFEDYFSSKNLSF